jgi:hypothetical protein
MFGWRQVGEPYRSTEKRYGLTVEQHKNGLWLNVFWGLWRWCYCRYNGQGRFTGPEENRSVLAYFLGGEDKRSVSRSFKSGFAEAAKKPLPRYADREL